MLGVSMFDVTCESCACHALYDTTTVHVGSSRQPFEGAASLRGRFGVKAARLKMQVLNSNHLIWPARQHTAPAQHRHGRAGTFISCVYTTTWDRHVNRYKDQRPRRYERNQATVV